MELSALPSVESLLAALRPQFPDAPHGLLKAEALQAIAAARAALREGQPAEPPLPVALARLQALRRPSLRPVINATGVILHTNLGRAPLAAFTPIEGYCNLEYDLATGRRGKRDTHVGALLERLTGAPSIAVNNNAAAVYLVLHALAKGKDVIVSRGELIEIGDGFRIPDIMRAAGVRLIEVGATNRTSLADYANAITPKTALLLRVHPSNFHITGFTAKPSLAELVSLNIPVYEDLGSGALVDLRPYGVNEPLVQDSLRAGAALVTYSGDKLLGGPQAGYISGQPDLIAKVRRNPMFRALRLDKLVLQSMEQTLRALLWQDFAAVPALSMIALTVDQLRARAAALASCLPGAELLEGRGVIGGGSTPDQSLPAVLIAVPGPPHRHERRLRARNIIARVEGARLLIDLRTVLPAQEPDLAAALRDL
ncbi:MAG TPA: L-seryl-tRNA(Sec) selenium transferase [Bryobacteraceae bacterium]|nr:L-seryl-tRNA(Sec) selenium transferase [Bryobacteraceae bacterium]